MENDQRGSLAGLLEAVKGDPKTSAALVVLLEAIIEAVLCYCEDCGNAQGAALEGDEPVRAGLTDDESNAIGQVAAALANAENLPGVLTAEAAGTEAVQMAQDFASAMFAARGAQ